MSNFSGMTIKINTAIQYLSICFKFQIFAELTSTYNIQDKILTLIKQMDPLNTPKTYWSILESFLNNKYCAFHKSFMKTILLLNLSKTLSYSHPAKQYFLINNDNIIPSDLPHKVANFQSHITFSSKDIAILHKIFI